MSRERACVDRGGRMRGGALRKALLALAALLLLSAIAVALLGPMVASSVASGVIRSAVAARTDGEVRVEGVSLSWTGPQRVRALKIVDADGSVIADLGLEAETSALGLALGSRDFGVIRLSGEAHLAPGADGGVRLSRTAGIGSKADVARGERPRASGAGGRLELPRGLAATLQFDGLTVVYHDAALTQTMGAAPGVEGLSGDVVFRVGDPIRANLKSGLAGGLGTISLDGEVLSLFGADGTMTLEQAQIDASITGEVDPSIADRLANSEGAIASATDDLIPIEARLKGGADSGTASIVLGDAARDAYAADIDLRYGDGSIALTRPGMLKAAVSERLASRLAPNEAMTLSGVTPVELDLETLSAPYSALGIGEGGLDLRGLSMALTLRIGEVNGTVRVGDEGAQAFTVAPAEVRIEAPDLDGRIGIRGSTSAALGGRDAGQLNLDLALRDVLDESGMVRTSALPRVEGRASVREASTALLTSFFEASGLDVRREIGESITLELTASTPGGDAAAPIEVDLTANAARLVADAALIIDESSIRSRGEGIVVRAESPGAAVEALLGALSERLRVEGRVEIAATEVRLPRDVKMISADSASAMVRMKGDRMSVRGAGDLEWLALTGVEAEASVAPRQPVRVSARGGVGDGGTLQVDLESPLEMNAAGGIDIGGLRPTGTVRVDGVSTSAVESLLELADD
ncbi:MAG: hypothetical protein VYC34_09255, partial [Planctomycetota bacterium]|nr:hypothetical protein [Planctomycetota bacterium]